MSTYGLLSEFSKRVVRDWIEQLVDQDYLVKTGEYLVLTVPPKGWRVLRGRETPRLLKPVIPQAPREAAIARTSWEGVDMALFEDLRKLRRNLADQRNVPAFVVFSDATLRDMARRKPATREEFLRVKGVGETKAGQYGEIFLERIKGHG